MVWQRNPSLRQPVLMWIYSRPQHMQSLPLKKVHQTSAWQFLSVDFGAPWGCSSSGGGEIFMCVSSLFIYLFLHCKLKMTKLLFQKRQILFTLNLSAHKFAHAHVCTVISTWRLSTKGGPVLSIPATCKDYCMFIFCLWFSYTVLHFKITHHSPVMRNTKYVRWQTLTCQT